MSVLEVGSASVSLDIVGGTGLPVCQVLEFPMRLTGSLLMEIRGFARSFKSGQLDSDPGGSGNIGLHQM